jgi:hypothetical protein
MIFLVTAYNPRPAPGDATVYQQHICLLSGIFRSHRNFQLPNPHRQFILHLEAWLESILHENHDALEPLLDYDKMTVAITCPQNLRDIMSKTALPNSLSDDVNHFLITN